MRLRPSLVTVALLAATASAQDRDPFEAAAQAQGVRARQMEQMQKADDRTYEPFERRTPEARRAQEEAALAARRAAVPAGDRSRPWLIPLGVAVAVGALWVAARSRRRS